MPKYETDSNRIASMLMRGAARALTSEPRPYKWDRGFNGRQPTLHQFVAWTTEEKQLINEYCAKYITVLGRVRYKQSDLLTDEPRLSAPLFSMLQHMLNDDCNPEYAVDNANRIIEALKTHKNLFESLEMEEMLGLGNKEI